MNAYGIIVNYRDRVANDKNANSLKKWTHGKKYLETTWHRNAFSDT